jgi:prepilin-type N-terminal cleavage/methylation domain-containing protein
MNTVDAGISKCRLLGSLQRRAFTLIELLVVIAVILILLGISLKMMSIVSNKTGTAKTLYVLEQTRNALDAYYSTVGSYPNTTVIKYDRYDGGGKASWGFDASSYITNVIGLTYYIGYESHPRAASWQKFVMNVSPAVITIVGSHTNPPVSMPGFDAITSTNLVSSIRDAWDRDVVYMPNASCDGYTLSSKGLDGISGTADDIGITKSE